MSFQDQIFIRSLALLMIGLPVLATFGFFHLRRRSMRGFEAAIAMDGATCVKGDDGRVVIRRGTARNIVLLLVLGSVFLGAVILLISTLIATVSGISTSGQSSSTLVLAVILILFLSPAIAVLVSSSRRPSVCFNPFSRMIEIGEGASMRRVSFSSISHIGSIRTKKRTLHREYGESETMAVYALAVVLRDDEQIQLGTVSGEILKAKKRATDVDQMISQALRASRAYE